MADFFGMEGSIGDIGASILQIGFYVIAAAMAIIIIMVIGKTIKNKKSFNIPVTIWIPRSDNKILDEVPAMGGYFKSKAVGGITSFRLKRKGVSIVEMPPPASRFLVGMRRHLYLVQKGMDDFEPVLPESFMNVSVEGSGKRKAVVNLKCVNQDATAWKCDNESNAKKRFTFSGFWEKYKDFIQITIFIFIVFLAMYVMWTGLKDVAVALGEVAKSLGPAVSNAPVVS